MLTCCLQIYSFRLPALLGYHGWFVCQALLTIFVKNKRQLFPEHLGKVNHQITQQRHRHQIISGIAVCGSVQARFT